MRTIIEQQLKHNDCGVSAVKIIYNLHDITIDRSYIEENIHLTDSGSSISEIKEFLDKEHFNTEFNMLDLNTLKLNPQKLKNFLPCILPVKNNQGNHYVVIKGISNKKIHVFDPAKGEIHKWTFSELMNNAYIATANYDLVSNREILQQIISEELSAYHLNTEDLESQDKADIINKLTYFSYVKENFGFANKEAEKAFLKDILFNQQLSTLPKQFRALKLSQDKLRIKAPVVLTVKKSKEAAFTTANAYAPEKIINPYRRLFNELKQYHKLWLIYLATAIFAALLTQVTVFSNQILIDNILPDFNTNLLILFAIGLGVFKLFDLILSIYKNFIAIHLANILDNYFLSSFISKLNNFPIRYIHSYSRGDLTERIKDSLRLKTFFIQFFTEILIDSFVTVYALFIMFLINWEITFIVIGVLILFIIWFKFITPYIRENEKRRFMEKSNLFSSLFENIDGLQVIKSFRLETLFKQRIAPKIKSILEIQKRVRYVNLVNSAVIDLLIIIASILIIVFLTRNAINTQNISIGQIITFIALSSEIFSSVSNMLSENLDLQENEIILTRYFDFGKAEYKVERTSIHNNLKAFDINTIEFKNVAFHYVPQKPVFSDLNIIINKGEKIKLEGSNGTGKSTFCKVLSLLYLPDSGDILINNEKQLFYNPSSLRKKILLVSNEDILFNDTIGYNITFNYTADTEDILSLAKEIGLYDFIADKDEGLDYVINEQGRNLSTGQRKKILLMRALFSEAEIIIMDETLSGIDIESREKVEYYINSQTERSFIIISHEPLNHIEFSKTLMMKDGRIEQLQYQGI
jgi:subfamily B ATP-binding cassette protein HlyB/CyaB